VPLGKFQLAVGETAFEPVLLPGEAAFMLRPEAWVSIIFRAYCIASLMMFDIRDN
jgi:hypothetical protein